MRYLKATICVAILIAFTVTAFAAQESSDKGKRSYPARVKTDKSAMKTGLNNEYQQIFNEATSKFEAKEYDEAIILLTKVINEYPSYIPAYKTRGLAFMEKGEITKANISKVDPTVRYTKSIYEYQKAVKNFTKIVQLDPDLDYPYYYRAVSNIELYYYSMPAIEDMNTYIDTFDNRTADAYYMRGCAYLQRGFLAEAEVDFKKVIELDQNHADAYAGIMKAYVIEEKYDNAISYFGNQIDRHPQNALPRYYRGLAYLQMEDYAKAIADFEGALKIYPEYSDAQDMRREALRDAHS